MKILIFTNNYNTIGGIQQYTKNFIRALEELNQNFKIVLLKKSDLFYKFLFVIESFFKFIFYRPDLILCNHINFAPLASFYKKIFKVNFVVICHGVEVWDIKSTLKKESLRQAKIIISVSKFTTQKLENQIPELEDNKKIFLLPNSVNEKEFYPKQKPQWLLDKYKLTDKNKVILTVARLSSADKYKGYDKVIQALPKILEQIPEARYMIVGDGDDINRIKELIESLSLQNHVILTGKVKETVDYYNIADVFVMPSKGEGFGIVFIEALACGVPVIAGNKDASKEALLNGELGILVYPDNVDEIAEAIIKVLKGEAPKHLYDKNYLRQKVIENFSFEVFKNRVKIFLESIS
jgi:glycosyltransferase involved in cell wall biosynthesis